MIDFWLGVGVGIGLCVGFVIICGLIDIHRWDRKHRV